MTDGDNEEPGTEPAPSRPSLKYSPDFFLGLGAKGKDAWNAWRQIDPSNAATRVTFNGVDFSVSPRDEIDFADFEFGDWTDFSGCKWRGVEWAEIRAAPTAFKAGRASFRGAIFGDGATFTNATFGAFADFATAKFGQRADFTNALFGERSNFGGALFDFSAIFAGAKFGLKADFNHASFGDAANFSGANFGNAARFTAATFGDVTSFENTTFDDAANFTDASFGEGTIFSKVTFGRTAQFAFVIFGNGASFVGATFGDRSQFRYAVLGHSTDFIGAIFGNYAGFTKATFGPWANFHKTTFGSGASFCATTFGYEADFTDVTFNGAGDCSGLSVDQWTKDFDRETELTVEKTIRTRLKQQHEESRALNGSQPDRFLDISFSGARFHGEATFSDRSFSGTADFTDTRFYSPPDIDGASNVGRVDLTGATIQFVGPKWPWWKPHWTKDPAIAVRLRTIRKVAEETKNHDLERDLYVEERKAERGPKLSRLWRSTRIAASRFSKAGLVMLHRHWPTRPAMLNWNDPPRVALRRAWRERARCLIVATGRLASYGFWIAVMAAYGALADYGRSFVRPLFWLAGSWLFFRWRYEAVFAPIKKGLAVDQVTKYREAVHMVALGHTVPIVGALTIDPNIKKFLFCGPIKECVAVPPPGFQGLVIAQNLVSILLVFFIGLALRNYFKIK